MIAMCIQNPGDRMKARPNDAPPQGRSSKWPDDLASWGTPRALLDLVLEASQHADLNPTVRAAWERQGLNPRVMLSILLYGLARGIYASTELSRQIQEDPILGYLAVGATCRDDDLARFRRHHGSSLREGLARVIRGMVAHDRESRPASPTPTGGLTLEATSDGGIDEAAEEAKARLTWAIRRDSMEGDV